MHVTTRILHFRYMSMLKKVNLALCFLLISSPIVCQSGQSSPVGRLFHYTISSRGIGVGKLKTAISPVQYAGERALRFESDLAIYANLILFRIAKNSREDAVIGERGTLSYHRRGEENGRSSRVDAELDGGLFRFKMSQNGVALTVLVPRSSYDFTTMDCPETTMQREGETMEVRLLDLEHARVVARRFHWIKTEELEVGGKRMRCKVVDFIDENNVCRRWVSRDEHGVIIVRQDGKGKGGNYSLRMVSVENGPAFLQL